MREKSVDGMCLYYIKETAGKKCPLSFPVAHVNPHVDGKNKPEYRTVMASVVWR